MRDPPGSDFRPLQFRGEPVDTVGMKRLTALALLVIVGACSGSTDTSNSQGWNAIQQNELTTLLRRETDLSFSQRACVHEHVRKNFSPDEFDPATDLAPIVEGCSR